MARVRTEAEEHERRARRAVIRAQRSRDRAFRMLALTASMDRWLARQESEQAA